MLNAPLFHYFRVVVLGLFLCCLARPASAQPWTSLFDGKSLSGWTNEKGEPASEGAWQIVDGTLHLDTTDGRGGNLLTEREFGDFQLQFEWKVAEKANNGIKYRVRDFDGRTLGLEYQMIDDPNQPNLKPKHKTASIYDIYAPLEHDYLRPAGQYNHSVIVVENDRIEHWLNGHLLTTAQVGGKEWNERLEESKFKNVPGFGLNQVGRIMLTDHKDKVWYRSIQIRERRSRSAPPMAIAYPSPVIEVGTFQIDQCQPVVSCAPCCNQATRRQLRRSRRVFKRRCW